MSNVQLLLGDAQTVLRTLPSGCAQTCCTSPPYFGLRSYLTNGHADKGLELGGEPTPEAYVTRMVEVFREVRRVLRDDATLWLNLGDSYASNGGPEPAQTIRPVNGASNTQNGGRSRTAGSLKPKDLIGIPWMVAFALRADGWYLRSDIIWHKPNPMPESVTDRPTKAHEYIFLLSKSSRYFYDADAVREPLAYPEDAIRDRRRIGVKHEAAVGGNLLERKAMTIDMSAGRNRRSVWTVATKPYAGAHFATFPPALVEPCILAGTSQYGACAACGAPWMRQVERRASLEAGRTQPGFGQKIDAGGFTTNGHGGSTLHHDVVKTTTGWAPTCTCQAPVVPCTVIDPFNGSGTSGVVSVEQGRRYIGIDLSADYLELARERIAKAQLPLLERVL